MRRTILVPKSQTHDCKIVFLGDLTDDINCLSKNLSKHQSSKKIKSLSFALLLYSKAQVQLQEKEIEDSEKIK